MSGFAEVALREAVEVVGFGSLFAGLGLVVLGPARALAEARAHTQSAALNLLYFPVRLFLFAPVIAVTVILTERAIAPHAPHDAAFWSVMPFWAQVLFATLVLDFLHYWRHRILHWPIFWPIHAIHHSDPFVQWHTGLRFHPLESLWAALISVLTPLLMGAPTADVPTFLGAASPFAVAAILRTVWGYWAHVRWTWSFGPLQYLFVTPLQHQWHHCIDGDGVDKNFATMWSLWDVVFGTYYVPSTELPTQGIGDAGFPNEFPLAVVGQTLWPFVAWVDRARASDERTT